MQQRLAQSQPAAQVRHRILVLYDEDKDDFPGLASIDRTLRESFRSELGTTVEIRSESLDLSQFERAGYDSAVADFFRRKYAGTPLDLIVAVMEPSLDFLLRHGETLFPGVPIVFCGVDASTIAGKTLRPNVTGVLVKRTFSPTLEVVLQLQPETRNVFVVGGASTFDRYLETFVRRDLQPFEGRVDITYLFGLSMDAWLTRLSSLPANSVILYTSVFTDGAGLSFVPHEAVASIAAAANAPVYVFVDQYVGRGPVGGNVYSVDMHGAQVAALGLQIVRGASPASLPIRELGSQVNLFDARQLERWNLDEARLPPGSVVLNQDASVWARYRWYIVVAIAVLATQGALIGGLLARARAPAAGRGGSPAAPGRPGARAAGHVTERADELAGPRDRPAAHCDHDERARREPSHGRRTAFGCEGGGRRARRYYGGCPPRLSRHRPAARAVSSGAHGARCR